MKRIRGSYCISSDNVTATTVVVAVLMLASGEVVPDITTPTAFSTENVLYTRVFKFNAADPLPSVNAVDLDIKAQRRMNVNDLMVWVIRSTGESIAWSAQMRALVNKGGA